jgi:hypothetical protein
MHVINIKEIPHLPPGFIKDLLPFLVLIDISLQAGKVDIF